MTDDQLKQLTSLTILKLDYNDLITGHGISTLTNLTLLNAHCRKGDFNDAMLKLTKLKSLDISPSPIMSWNIINCDTLCKLTQLETLTLAFQPTYIESLESLTNLTHLVLGPDQPFILYKSVEKLTSLTHLSLDHNSVITPEDVAPFFQYYSSRS